jgi:hypothetical protein
MLMDNGTQPFKIVRVYAHDDSIAMGTPEANAAYQQYHQDRDFSKLHWVPGSTPTVYHGRCLTPSEIRHVRNRGDIGDQYEAAFLLGLVKVEHLEYPDGIRREWVMPTDHSGKPKPLPDAERAKFFDEAIVQEIGMVIRQRSFLDRQKERWYPLPDICQDVLRGRLRRRVAQTQGTPSSPQSSPPASVDTAAGLTSSPAGAASTDATATV